MTKSEFNRFKNFIEEKDNPIMGFITYKEDPKSTKREYATPIDNIYVDDDEFVVTKRQVGSVKIKIHRKRVLKLELRGMERWIDVKGQRQKKLSKIL